MRVRVYDRERDGCFLSELYAVVGVGIFARCLVAFAGRLRMYHQVLSGEDGNFHTMASMIEPDYPAEWIRLHEGNPGDRPDGFKVPPSACGFHGYPWVWEDQDTLMRLLRGEEIPLSKTDYPPVSSLLPGWNYVTDQARADTFMEEMGDFHDAVLVEEHYTSGSKKTPDNCMRVMDDIRQVSLLFHNFNVPAVELVFEGVKAFNLRPGGNNCVTSIDGAVCRVRNAMVFFSCGWCPEGEEASCADTCIWAYSLRWRYRPEGRKE